MIYNRSERVAVRTRCWRLDAPRAQGGARSAVFASYDFDGDGFSIPSLIHFGAALPSAENLDALAINQLIPVSGGMLDPLVPLTMCPTAMDGWTGRPGIRIETAELGEPRWFRLHSFEDDARMAASSAVWRFNAEVNPDSRGTVWGSFSAELDPDLGVLVLSNEVYCAEHLLISRFSAPVVSAAPDLDLIQDFGGRWCSEFQRQIVPFQTGQYVRENREGRSGHAGFPGCVLMSSETGESHGDALAITLPSSAGHSMVCEQVPSGRRQVQFEDATVRGLREDRHTLYLAASQTGHNGLSQTMTRFVRRMVAPQSASKTVARPVHYNCWEAVYFDHKLDELKDIATKAAALGAERFVLDDGWFKGRNDDRTSLGDWVVDTNKYPDGLHPLVDHVTGLGLRFGIWLEPEMVNRDSDLYRANPHWVLGNDQQPAGRQQYVLDLTLDGVCQYLFERIDALLSDYAVDYIKWDHNRALFGGLPEQADHLYVLLSRIRQAHPHVEIETCASGGGRIDYGILQHTNRVWLSDSNDALVRLKMQHEASRWLPAEVQGSHVGPGICHTSARQFSIGFRGWVAAQRHMGFEMDPRELSGEDAEALKAITLWYKRNREFLHHADLYRLDHADPEVFAEISVSQQRDRFILFKGQAEPSRTTANMPLRLAGLDQDTIYAISLENAQELRTIVNRRSSSQLLAGEAVKLSGAALMAGLLHLPTQFPASMLVLKGEGVSR